MNYYLEIDWNEFVSNILRDVSLALNSNSVISINTPTGVRYVRHIDWDYVANGYIKIKKMRTKYTNFLDKVENRIPDEGEQPRPGVSQMDIEKYENIRDEGYRLLEVGDAKLRTFNWFESINTPDIPSMDDAVGIVLTITQYTIEII